MDEIENDDWECSTCKQVHPLATDYECATCGMMASEHVSITTLCKSMRRWQDEAFSLEVENKKLRDALEKSIESAQRFRNEAESYIARIEDLQSAITFCLDNFSSRTLPAQSREFLKSL
jgi:predicted glutamine amidotransferase